MSLKSKEQEAHGPHRSRGKTVQINKHIKLYNKVDKKNPSSSLWELMILQLKKIESLHQRCIVPSFVETDRVVLEILSIYFRYFVIISLWKRLGPLFQQTWFLITQECLVTSVVEIGSVDLEKKTFKFSLWIFNSPEPEAQMSFSDRNLSVVRCRRLWHFHLLLQNHRANLNKTWHNASLGEGYPSLFKSRATYFTKGDN